MNITFPVSQSRIRFSQNQHSQQHLEAIEQEVIAVLNNQGISANGYFLRQRNTPLVFHVGVGQESQAQTILAGLPDVTPNTSNDHHLKYKNIPIWIDSPFQ